MEFLILGPLEARRDGSPVALGGVKPRALLALLVLADGRPVPAEQLAVALWGDDASGRSVKTLQVYVARLRAALGEPDVIITTSVGYAVRATAVDADRFVALAAEGERALAEHEPQRAADVLREALALWRGPALADLVLEGFVQSECARLEEQRLTVLEARVEADLAAGRHRVLVSELQQLVIEHPLRERLRAHLMLALYRSGRQADALQAFADARERLVNELGLEPGPQLRDLQQAILAQDPVLAPAGSGAPIRVPRAPTPTFGRQAEIARVAALLHSARIVTLVGPGGVGKTQVALEAAHTVAADFHDGACFVSLAGIERADAVAPTVARDLDLVVQPGEAATEALERYLRARTLLLVLDNFEHVLDAAAIVTALLLAAQELTVLVTSREPLRVRAERVLAIEPLGLDDAVALFAAAADAGGHPLAEHDRADARQICARLDRLPLAIELAAARTSVLSPSELLTRLHRALPMLTGGPRDQPDRQRTLRATIAWSYRLLDEEERAALVRLSVFPAGATVTAAEAVTAAALDVLGSLAAKHLLTRSGARLTMLETVREFALEHLDAIPQAAAVRARMAHWALAFLQEATPELRRHHRSTWVDRIADELPNLTAALGWALAQPEAELALELAGELGTYARETGGWAEGLPLVDAALALPGHAPPRARAAALLAQARFLGRRDLTRYRASLEEAAALFRAADDDAGEATCLAHLAVVAMWNGQADAAAGLGKAAIAHAERSGNDVALAIAVSERAIALDGYEAAAGVAACAAQELKRIGDFAALALVCSITGYKALAEGRDREALRWLDDGLAAARSSGQRFALCHVHGNLGLARLFLDDLSGASEAFAAALSLARATGVEHLVSEVLTGVAAIAAQRGELSTAAKLAGAGRSSLATAITERQIQKRLDRRFLAPARRRFEASRWDQDARAGAILDRSAAIALASAAAR